MDKTARPQVELPDNRSTLLSGDLDVFASQYPKTADRIRAELNRLATRLAESEARAVGDARRLDYIERTFSGMTNRERYLPVQMIWGKGCNGLTLREACDKYMARDDAAQEAKRDSASA